MHSHLRPFIALALLTLLLAAPSLALAHGEGRQQTVDGYTLTLVLPEKGFFTGHNPVSVMLWDWQGKTPEATVNVLLLAYTPPSGGHSDTHGEAALDDHAAADDYAATDSHGATDNHTATDSHGATDNHAATDSHGATDNHAATDDHSVAEAEHSHDGASALEGRGLAVAPVALVAGHELGEYQGEIAFEEAGIYTLSVVFSIDGEERGALFDVEVGQSRPRGLVLGGFAFVNALAIGAAAFLKWRAPAKPARKPARPTPVATPRAEEQPQ